MTGREYVRLGAPPSLSYLGREGRGDHAATGAALARLDLGGLAERRLGTLSGGERQRGAVAGGGAPQRGGDAAQLSPCDIRLLRPPSFADSAGPSAAAHWLRPMALAR